jgi:hypothetical protein
MAHISQSNWEVDYFIAPNTDLRLGLCDYNGTRVIFAASIPFIYVNYTAGFAFTDMLASQSGNAEIRQIMDGFDIRATYDLYGPDYLYEHIWRFYDDGQFGSSVLIHGPGEEHDGQHTYHVPFRYDLDISGAGADSFQRWLSLGIIGFWASPPQEGQFVANPSIPPAFYDWQILDNLTGKRAMARARDGDNAEIWALQYSPVEAWASWGGAQSSPPGSPGSVPAVYDNNQSIQNTDVVLWYIAHIPSLNLITGGGPSFKLLGY